MDVLTLAARHRDWLATRQTVIAANIANVNTPDFAARDVVPFSAVLGRVEFGPRLAAPQSGHLSVDGSSTQEGVETFERAGDATHAGNTVSVESELIAAGATKREYALNVAISRTLRRMIMANLRG